jgi:hypothetical protein
MDALSFGLAASLMSKFKVTLKIYGVLSSEGRELPHHQNALSSIFWLRLKLRPRLSVRNASPHFHSMPATRLALRQRSRVERGATRRMGEDVQ